MEKWSKQAPGSTMGTNRTGKGGRKRGQLPCHSRHVRKRGRGRHEFFVGGFFVFWGGFLWFGGGGVGGGGLLFFGGANGTIHYGMYTLGGDIGGKLMVSNKEKTPKGKKQDGREREGISQIQGEVSCCQASQ